MVLADHSLVGSSQRVAGSARPEVAALANRWGRPCLETVTADGGPAGFAADGVYWHDPGFESGAWFAPVPPEPEQRDPRELEMGREHLKALGYVQ